MKLTSIIGAFLMMIGCSIHRTDQLNIAPTVKVYKDQSGVSRYTGLKIPKDYHPDAKHVRGIPPLKVLPSHFDWREQTQLHPVRDQGNCGSCWAMATTSVFEDALRIKAGIQRDVAEQFPLSCSKTYLNENWSCDGGLFAYDIFKNPYGAVNESDFPYTASDSVCKVAGISYYEKLKSWAYLRDDDTIPPIDEIKSAIYLHGPVGTAVAVDNAFSNYNGGIHSACNSTAGLNHAVVLVGWDDAGGYWIMRNSWGTGWGESGYMRLKYGCDAIGSWTNYIALENENPTPTPIPPDPTPTPVPPGPTPPPECTPQPYADTGYGPVISVRRGQIINVGIKARPETTYLWTAEPAFDNNARPETAQIRYQPKIQKKLKITATTKCGSVSASVLVQLKGVSTDRYGFDTVH